MRSLVVGLLLVVASGSAARADDALASGSIAVGPNVTVAVCYLFNVGTGTQTLRSIGIYHMTPFGPLVVESISNSCGSTLVPRQTCRTVSNVPGSGRLQCQAVVGNKGNMRGDFQLRSGSATFQHDPLR
jgi:hypothetical protein